MLAVIVSHVDLGGHVIDDLEVADGRPSAATLQHANLTLLIPGKRAPSKEAP